MDIAVAALVIAAITKQRTRIRASAGIGSRDAHRTGFYIVRDASYVVLRFHD